MHRWSPVKVLVGFVAIFGTGYILTLPPFGWGDEVPHYLRALRLSQGQAIPAVQDGMRGVFASSRVKETIQGSGIAALLWKVCKLAPAHVRDLVWAPVDKGEMAFVPEYGAPYPPLSSVHTAAAVWLARQLHSSPVVWFYAARLANLALWWTIAVATLRLAPVLNMTMLTLLLSPTALFLGATLSVDGVLDAVAFLWTAYVLRLVVDAKEPPPVSTWLCSLSLVTLLSLMKMVYAPMALLLLLVPARRRGSAWRPWLVLSASAAGAGAVAVLLWLAFVPFPTQSIMFLPTPGATYDVTRILFDPFGSLVALPKTALADGYSWLLQLAGPYWNECTSGEDLALPLVCGAIVLAVILDADRFRPTVAQRLIGLLVFSGTYGTVILVALASWTPMGDDRALGVHVRYFLPALPALAIALMPPAPHLHAHWARVARITIVVALAVSAAIVQIGFLGRYDW